jgi:hypothetical protein
MMENPSPTFQSLAASKERLGGLCDVRPDPALTLVNASSNTIDLKGWQLADKQKKKQPLQGTIGAGAAILITVKKPMELSNQGGIITLLNDDGLKVDGVSYTKKQASNPGWTIVF